MQDIKLRFPVHTVENEILLPAGAALSEETLQELVSRGKSMSFETYPLLKFGRVRGNLLRLLQRPPYDSIFSDYEMITDVMKLMEMVQLAHPILQSLDYFKQHDYHTYCHILVVFALSTLLARDLVPNHLDQLREAAVSHTHDIGKICVPLHIMKKRTPLTKEERDILNHHPAAGYVMLNYYLREYDHLSARVARDHHERKDGSGHPRGIMLKERMIEIVVVSDVYDALVSPRPYRNAAYDNRTALEELTKMAEANKIEWEVVRALVAHNRRARKSYQETEVSLEKRGVPPAENCYGVTEDGKDQ